MKFLADECIGLSVARWLSNRGYDVVVVGEENPGITDIQVLAQACREGRILITNDTDFGELIFRHRLNHKGIILFRLENDFPQTIIVALEKILSVYANQLKDCFVVVSDKTVRIIAK